MSKIWEKKERESQIQLADGTIVLTKPTYWISTPSFEETMKLSRGAIAFGITIDDHTLLARAMIAENMRRNR